MGQLQTVGVLMLSCASLCAQLYNVFSYLVLDLGFSPVTLSVGALTPLE